MTNFAFAVIPYCPYGSCFHKHLHQVTLRSSSLSHFCIIQKPTSKPQTSISTRQPPLFQLIMQFLSIDPTVSGRGTISQWKVVFYQFLHRELCFKLLQEWTGQQKSQPCAVARELPQFKAVHHAGVQQETTAFQGANNKHHLTFGLVKAAYLTQSWEICKS